MNEKGYFPNLNKNINENFIKAQQRSMSNYNLICRTDANESISTCTPSQFSNKISDFSAYLNFAKNISSSENQYFVSENDHLNSKNKDNVDFYNQMKCFENKRNNINSLISLNSFR